MPQILIQCFVFAVIGAGVYGACKLLRCRPGEDLGIAGPRTSALRAFGAVGASMTAVFLLMLRQYLRHRLGDAPAITRPSDLLPQLLVLVIYAGPAAVFMILGKERLRTAGIGKPNLWQSLLIGAGLASLTLFFRPDGFSHLSHLRNQDALLLLYYAFVGFGEEFLFRGYLQTRLVLWLGTWKGWLAASVTMALVHWPHRWLLLNMTAGAAQGATLSLVPVSLLMGCIMLRTRNILAPALFHTFANWVAELP